jgi:glycerol uptake operon antiterminator
MNKQEFLQLAQYHPIAAGIKTQEDREYALAAHTKLLFLLKGDALSLAPYITEAHEQGKRVIVHVDLMSGIGKDRAGIEYLRQMGADGIITSRSQLIVAGRAEGILTIQRLLLLDDSGLEAGVRTIARSQPDVIEVLPGIIFPEVGVRLRKLLKGPFIAGGFLRTRKNVDRVLAAGATLCSSSTHELWH